MDLKKMIKNLDAVKTKKTKLCNLDCKNCKYNQIQTSNKKPLNNNIYYGLMCVKYGIWGGNSTEIKNNVLFEIN